MTQEVHDEISQNRREIENLENGDLILFNHIWLKDLINTS
jgi:hypothetical protein